MLRISSLNLGVQNNKCWKRSNRLSRLLWQQWRRKNNRNYPPQNKAGDLFTAVIKTALMGLEDAERNKWNKMTISESDLNCPKSALYYFSSLFPQTYIYCFERVCEVAHQKRQRIGLETRSSLSHSPAQLPVRGSPSHLWPHVLWLIIHLYCSLFRVSVFLKHTSNAKK